MCNLRALERGQPHARLLDESVEPPERIEFSLDPRLDAQQNAQQRYQRARKLERGTGIAQERLVDTERVVDELRALIAQLDAAPLEGFDEAALRERAAELDLGAISSGKAAKKQAGPQVRMPYRTFLSSGGRPILVGRGAADNDRLTLDHAKPHDLWLHARDDSGAHVVVPLRRDEACPPELLCDAATLAAHFSQARGQSRVDVTYTRRRYVRKPRKSATGSVQLMREKVFALRLEPERLRRLLAAEKARRA